MIDKECLECKRYHSGSCDGVEDRKREEIIIENSCSGFLQFDTEDVIENLFLIIHELDARYHSSNLVISKLESKTWNNLCEEGIKLFERIK